MAQTKAPTQPKVDAVVAWELTERLEECMAWVEDDDQLLNDAEQSIESFKFALALEGK